jgi:hypothetical protein
MPHQHPSAYLHSTGGTLASRLSQFELLTAQSPRELVRANLRVLGTYHESVHHCFVETHGMARAYAKHDTKSERGWYDTLSRTH